MVRTLYSLQPSAAREKSVFDPTVREPVEDTEIAGLKTKMTVQAETADSAPNMDQTPAIFESSGLSKAQIEAKLMAAVQAGVPQAGTPAYYEYSTPHLELSRCSLRS